MEKKYKLLRSRLLILNLLLPFTAYAFLLGLAHWSGKNIEIVGLIVDHDISPRSEVLIVIGVPWYLFTYLKTVWDIIRYEK